MRRFPLILACLVALPIAAPAAAGTDDLHSPTQAAPAVRAPATLTGRVLDASGAPIVGARVTAAGTAGDAKPLVAVTDAAGRFSLALAPGAWTIGLAATGFTEVSHRVQVDTTDTTRDFVLPVAGVVENVRVSAALADVGAISSATRTLTPLRDVPQSVTVVTRELITDQLMMSVGDVVKYVPGITAHQGENNRDDLVIRGNRSSADFFLNGVRDDVQYYRDLYNVDRVEALKGSNAMIFGRGGGGGVVNRVIKEAVFQPVRSATLQTGGDAHKRVTADVNQPIGGSVALRVNGMFEHSGSFRDGVNLERSAANPTLTFAPGARTKIAVGYERLADTRVADRGIPSYQGRPVDVPASTYYGDAANSRVRSRVDLATASIERQFGGATVRSRVMAGGYDRFYQNYVPGAVSADGRQVTMTAYTNASHRENVFNQTELMFAGSTGAVRHTIVAAAEVGRQHTDNFRRTGFFNNASTSTFVPFGAPTGVPPVTFRQSATDADNHVRASVAAVSVQDQVDLAPRVLAIGGVRLDRFDLQYHNNRTGDSLGRTDDLVSPRLGLVVKPVVSMSLYGSYGVSYLPSAGDQFSSLTTVTQQLKPERFTNYEVGMKWDVRPALAFTTAVYRLDRTNTRSTDPNDPTRVVQTGSQRTNGYELGLNGRVTRAWRVAGGYAYQDAFVTRATTAARAGAHVAQVPHHTFSLWNHYHIHPRLAGGLGIIRRSDMFAAIDNTVTLAAYTRADAAAYFTIRKGLRLQANVENLFDTKYFVNADNNTNISPGAPRLVRLALVTSF